MPGIAMADLQKQLCEALARFLAGNQKPAIPEAGRLLWSIFVDLAKSRSYGANGPNPISFAEIEAFARLNRWPLQPHHVEIIRALDETWLKHGQPTERRPGRLGPAQPMNVAAFDAVFG